MSRKLRILHHHHGLPSQELLEGLEENQNSYLHRIECLKTLQSQNKKKNKEKSHYEEWKNEHTRLQQLNFKFQQAITETLQSLIANDAGNFEYYEIIQELTNVDQEIKNTKDNTMMQLRDLKKLIREFQASKKPGNNGKETQIPETNDKCIINSILADVFVKYRVAHSDYYANLKIEEEKFMNEVISSRNYINSMIQSDIIEEQNRQLQLEIKKIFQDILPSPPLISLESQSVSSNNPLPIQPPQSIDASTNQIDDFLHLDIEIQNQIQIAIQKIQQLDLEHQISMQSKEKEKIDFLSQIEMDPNHPQIQYGTWDKDNHQIFHKIYRQAQSTGMQRKIMLNLLQTELDSNYSLDEILLHEEWHRKMKAIQQKYQNNERIYSTSRQDLLQQITISLTKYKEDRIKLLEEERQYQIQEQKRFELHQLLFQLKQEKDLKDQQLLYEKQLLETQKEQEFQANKQKHDEYNKQQKDLLQQYHEEQQKKLQIQKEEQDKLEAQRRDELQKLIQENKSKIEFRQKQYENKQILKRQKEEELLESEKQKLFLLQKLAEQVPYYDAIKDIDSKLDHITVSAANHAYFPPDANPTRGHLPLLGFTDQKIVRDTRFRIVEALRMANLQQSHAARDIVAQYHPRPHLAIHGLL